MKFKTLLECSCLMASIVNATEVPANYNIQGSLGGLGRAINSHILAEMRNGEDVQQFLTASRAISETKQDSLYFWAIGKNRQNWAIGKNRQNYYLDQITEAYNQVVQQIEFDQITEVYIQVGQTIETDIQLEEILLNANELQSSFKYLIDPNMWKSAQSDREKLGDQFWKYEYWKEVEESLSDPVRTVQLMNCCYGVMALNDLLNQIKAIIKGGTLDQIEGLTLNNIGELIASAQKEGSNFQGKPDVEQRLEKIEELIQWLQGELARITYDKRCFPTDKRQKQYKKEQQEKEPKERLGEILSNINDLASVILSQISENGLLFLTEDLIECGVDVNASSELRYWRIYRFNEGESTVVTEREEIMPFDSPLHVASHKGHLPIVEYLIGHGADVNKADWYGRTPLYMASERGHLSIVELLVNHGADVNKADNYGDIPLHMASEYGNLSIVEYLINHGADVNKADRHGETPLYIASYEGHSSTAESLLSNGADVNGADNRAHMMGYTPLHAASGEGRLSIVELLLQHGADVNKTDNSGRTPLQYASEYKEMRIVECLVSHGANVNGLYNNTSSPLHYAAMNGDLPMVEYLVSHGADIKKTDRNGHTPLDSAALAGHEDVKDYLQQRGNI